MDVSLALSSSRLARSPAAVPPRAALAEGSAMAALAERLHALHSPFAAFASNLRSGIAGAMRFDTAGDGLRRMYSAQDYIDSLATMPAY